MQYVNQIYHLLVREHDIWACCSSRVQRKLVVRIAMPLEVDIQQESQCCCIVRLKQVGLFSWTVMLATCCMYMVEINHLSHAIGPKNFTDCSGNVHHTEWRDSVRIANLEITELVMRDGYAPKYGIWSVAWTDDYVFRASWLMYSSYSGRMSLKSYRNHRGLIHIIRFEPFLAGLAFRLEHSQS